MQAKTACGHQYPVATRGIKDVDLAFDNLWTDCDDDKIFWTSQDLFLEPYKRYRNHRKNMIPEN